MLQGHYGLLRENRLLDPARSRATFSRRPFCSLVTMKTGPFRRSQDLNLLARERYWLSFYLSFFLSFFLSFPPPFFFLRCFPLLCPISFPCRSSASDQNEYNPFPTRQIPSYFRHCERSTWLRQCGNVVLWQIFGPKREEVRRGWEVVPHEELCDIHILSDAIRAIQSLGIAQCR